MKYIAILSLLFFSTLTIAADNTPVVAATNFYDALKSNNIAEARTLIVNPDELPNDGSTSFDVAGYYFFRWKVVKNAATIKTATTTRKGTLSFDTVLKNINGKWKVDFNKTIMNMASSAIKKKQVHGQVQMNIEQK